MLTGHSLKYHAEGYGPTPPSLVKKDRERERDLVDMMLSDILHFSWNEPLKLADD